MVTWVGEGLDHQAELRWIDVALAVPLRGEVDDVQDAGEPRVLLHHGPYGFGQVLAAILGLVAIWLGEGFAAADHSPVGLSREVEAE